MAFHAALLASYQRFVSQLATKVRCAALFIDLFVAGMLTWRWLSSL